MVNSVYNPFSEQEEVIFKDKDGAMKILKGGQVQMIEAPLAISSQVAVSSPSQVFQKKNLGGQSPQNYNPAIDRIVEKLELDIMDPILSKRLRNIILSRLKGVRNDIEIQETLTRPIKVGGLGLDDKKAQEAVRVIRQQVGNIDELLRSRPALGRAEATRPRPSRDEVGRPGKREEKKETKAPEKVSGELSQKVDSPRTWKVKESSSSETVKPALPDARLASKPFTQVVQVDEDKAKVDTRKKSVAISPKLVGPIEELSQMTITDFRRLESDPKKAANKVMDKIKLLAKESFANYLLAIEAWRQSEVFFLYTQLGTESLETKRPIKKVIERKIQDKRVVLTEEEFTAIMDLNQKMRF